MGSLQHPPTHASHFCQQPPPIRPPQLMDLTRGFTVLVPASSGVAAQTLTLRGKDSTYNITVNSNDELVVLRLSAGAVQQVAKFQ